MRIRSSCCSFLQGCGTRSTRLELKRVDKLQLSRRTKRSLVEETEAGVVGYVGEREDKAGLKETEHEEGEGRESGSGKSSRAYACGGGASGSPPRRGPAR